MRSNVSTMVKTYSCGYPRDLGGPSATRLCHFFFPTTSTVTVEQAVNVAYIVLVVSPLVSLMVDQVASLSEDTATSNSTPMRLAQPCFFPSAVKVPNECFDCVSVGQR